MKGPGEIGQRVKLSAEAKVHGIGGTEERGVICGRPFTPNMVRVQRDGIKRPETWHEKFWEVDQ